MRLRGQQEDAADEGAARHDALGGPGAEEDVHAVAGREHVVAAGTPDRAAGVVELARRDHLVSRHLGAARAGSAPGCCRGLAGVFQVRMVVCVCMELSMPY